MNNPLIYFDPKGEDVWDGIKGLGTVVTGVSEMLVGAAVASTPTGVGQVAGTGLVIHGLATFSLGVAQAADGFSQKEKSTTNIPSGPLEGGGMLIDNILGDKSKSGEAVGAFLDFGISLSGGGIPNAKSGVKAMERTSELIQGVGLTEEFLLDDTEEKNVKVDLDNNINNFSLPSDNTSINEPVFLPIEEPKEELEEEILEIIEL